MENDNVVSGMIRKRAELAGEIDSLEGLMREKLIALDHLDAAIRIFRPDIDLEEIKPKPIPPRGQAGPGEMIRNLLTILRKATEPMSSHEITLALMILRSMNTADKGLVRTVSKRVIAALRNHRTQGTLRSYDTPGQALLWEIVR
jgi:hypothetical protein